MVYSQVRHSMRIAGGVHKSDRYAMVTKLRKEKEKDEKWKQAIKKAEVDEIEMLLVGLQALNPLQKEDIEDAAVHNSHLFTVEKFLVDGMHDKFKSRMVMNGNEQDRHVPRPVIAYGSHTLATYVSNNSSIQFYVCDGKDRHKRCVHTD